MKMHSAADIVKSAVFKKWPDLQVAIEKVWNNHDGDLILPRP
jgi:hypothetical protein